LVRSGRIYRLVKEAAAFGTRAENVRLDWPALVRRQHEIVRSVRPAPESLTRAGAKVYLSEARFTDPHTVQVNGATLRGEKIVIAAGSEPILPPLRGERWLSPRTISSFSPSSPPSYC
jgi:pyruvate/2-oxoglutarate dehydrogenase complex dihydrolipoamide dehydrogenase (E3) component